MYVFELNQRYVKFMPLFSFRKIFISLFIFSIPPFPSKLQSRDYGVFYTTPTDKISYNKLCTSTI